jgi:hypothetical protein
MAFCKTMQPCAGQCKVTKADDPGAAARRKPSASEPVPGWSTLSGCCRSGLQAARKKQPLIEPADAEQHDTQSEDRERLP